MHSIPLFLSDWSQLAKKQVARSFYCSWCLFLSPALHGHHIWLNPSLKSIFCFTDSLPHWLVVCGTVLQSVLHCLPLLCDWERHTCCCDLTFIVWLPYCDFSIAIMHLILDIMKSSLYMAVDGSRNDVEIVLRACIRGVLQSVLISSRLWVFYTAEALLKHSHLCSVAYIPSWWSCSND